MAETLRCSMNDCKERATQIKSMSFQELDKCVLQCSNCGNWIIKESTQANMTYDTLSSTWAVQFMKQVKY